MCEQKPLGGDWKGHFVYLPWLVETGKGICVVSVPEKIEKLSLWPFVVKSGSS